MDGVLVALRCVLAAVFAVAAAGKLLDVEGSRRALREFGVPSDLSRFGGVALPIAELTVAAGLVVRPSARFAAAAALILLIAFIGGVARALSQGRSPDCHCFGQFHSEPAGRGTLIRNVALAAAAVVILGWGTGSSLTGALGGLNGTQVGLVASATLTCLLAVAVLWLWNDRRGLVRSLEAARAATTPAGLRRGSPAPSFELTALRGGSGSLESLLDDGRPIVLVFVSTTCGPCLDMLPRLARWQESVSERVALVPIFRGAPDDIERLSSEHGLASALAQADNETFELYALRVTPSAVLIATDGAVASAPAEGAPAIEALIRTTIARSSREPVVAATG